MVYLADLSHATNLLERKPPKGQSFEALDDGDLRSAGVKAVAKTAAADLTRYGYRPQKLEGLALVDDDTLAAINDNDYGFSGFDGNGQPIPSGVETRLILIRLDKPLR